MRDDLLLEKVVFSPPFLLLKLSKCESQLSNGQWGVKRSRRTIKADVQISAPFLVKQYERDLVGKLRAIIGCAAQNKGAVTPND